jgi:hypothetical protein
MRKWKKNQESWNALGLLDFEDGKECSRRRQE